MNVLRHITEYLSIFSMKTSKALEKQTRRDLIYFREVFVNSHAGINYQICSFGSMESFNYFAQIRLRSRGSSTSIVTDYGLYDRGSIPDRARGFFF
jgi:hypothetical protein